jgi:hypothetical protein
MRRLISLIILSLVIFTGCETFKHNAYKPNVVIDWVNFIKFNDITYISIDWQGRELTEDDLGIKFDKIKFKVADNVNDPEYKIKNGDGAFLNKGTQVYTIKGYSPEFRLAAYFDKKLVVYEADSNPKAKKGKDLLDIKGKVEYISLNSETDGTTELATIKDKTKVEALVNMVLESPISEFRTVGKRCFVMFHLKDGTTVNRAFWLESGGMTRNILTSKDFRDEIKILIEKSM